MPGKSVFAPIALESISTFSIRLRQSGTDIHERTQSRHDLLNPPVENIKPD